MQTRSARISVAAHQQLSALQRPGQSLAGALDERLALLLAPQRVPEGDPVTTSLYWVSWYQPGDDWRAVTWPPPAPILAYWSSGSSSNDAETVVAVVRAASEQEVWAAVRGVGAWPDAGKERFCYVMDSRPGDRFPRPTDPEMAARWPWPMTPAVPS